jgi:hypothetical protein
MERSSQELNLGLRALATKLAAQGAWARRQEETTASRPVPPILGLGELLGMPLDRFAREGQSLEVRVPWHPETLWFVPDERDAAALGREGVGRGRVWTARELMDLMTLSDLTVATVRTLVLAKCAIDGDIVEVRSR